MKRRNFLQLAPILFGAGLSPSVLRALAAETAGQAVTGHALDFSDRQRQLIAALCDWVIPETDTPGARIAGVGEFIEHVVSNGFLEDDRDAFLAGLKDFEAVALAEHGTGFLGLGQMDQEMFIARIWDNFEPGVSSNVPTTAHEFFRVLRELTIIGFYTSEIGATQELRYLAMPGRYAGCVDFDADQPAWFDDNRLDSLL